MAYYLMDLERTLSRDIPYFWLKNKHGYTTKIEVAGLFAKEAAEEIVKNDINDLTVMIHINKVAEILQLEVNKI
jgi:pyruvoyl-dependent arginine decarboxylase (PvlArgDC)